MRGGAVFGGGAVLCRLGSLFMYLNCSLNSCLLSVTSVSFLRLPTVYVDSALFLIISLLSVSFALSIADWFWRILAISKARRFAFAYGPNGMMLRELSLAVVRGRRRKLLL
jgi:hypothetical protein